MPKKIEAGGKELTEYEESLLRKRRRDDTEQRRRIDAKAKAKLAQGRKKKEAEESKKAGGHKVTRAEVFVSNQMKQQRGFVHYKRNKSAITRAKQLQERFGDASAVNRQATQGDGTVKQDSLLLAVRIKGNTEGACTPQAEKIMKELGLRDINNAVFLKANSETIDRLIICQKYIAYGYPTKKSVNELLRKRGFLKKEGKKEAITNNVLIESMLGPDVLEVQEEAAGHMGCICVEDVIDTVFNCAKDDNDGMFKLILKVIWPFQIASLKETIEAGNMKHEAHGRDIRKKNT